MKANYKNKLPNQFKIIEQGSKVKLNIKQIKSHPDHKKKTKAYRDWIDSHAEDIFTVEYDKNNNPLVLVCLKEDTTSPKWLFWTGDLIEVKDNE